jgi:V8-like Glu-specific endopeptidase
MDVQRSSGSSAPQYSSARGDSETLSPPQRNGSAAHVVRSGPDRGWDLYLSRDDAGITVYQPRWRRQAGAASTERRPATLPRTIPGYSLLNVRSSDDTDTYRFTLTAGASPPPSPRPSPATLPGPGPASVKPAPGQTASASTGGKDAQALRLLGQRFPYGPANPSSTSHQLSEPEKYVRSLATFRVNEDAGTAFRLGPNNLFMTNAHVIWGDPDSSGNYRLKLGEERTTAHDGTKSPLSVRVDKVIERSRRGEGYDFVLFQIDPAEYATGIMDRFGYLGISQDPVRESQHVYIPNYANGLPKQIHSRNPSGEALRITHANAYLTYDGILGPGASGSPVIDAVTHDVVGIHHSGTEPGSLTAGGSHYSQGSRMRDTIWPLIARHFNGVPPKGSPLPSSVPTTLTPDDWLPPLPKGSVPIPWQANTSYKMGDFVRYEGRNYRATAASTPSLYTPDYGGGTWARLNERV